MAPNKAPTYSKGGNELQHQKIQEPFNLYWGVYIGISGKKKIDKLCLIVLNQRLTKCKFKEKKK